MSDPDGSSVCADSAALAQGEQPQFAIDPDTGLPVVAFLGDGAIQTCPGPRGATGTVGYSAYQLANCIDPYTLAPLDAGEAVVRYLPMNKYSIEPVVPPTGVDCGATGVSGTGAANCSDMLLTATLEGTRQNDAWVRAGEPRYNITLGQLNWLVFYGFVHPMNKLATLPGPRTGTISGQIVQAHDQHPPLLARPQPRASRCRTPSSASTTSRATTSRSTPPPPIRSTGQFSISGVPPGTYEVVMWDKPINEIIDFRTITLGTGPGQSMTASLGPVAIYGWFGRVRGHVFSDPARTGFPVGGVPLELVADGGHPQRPDQHALLRRIDVSSDPHRPRRRASASSSSFRSGASWSSRSAPALGRATGHHLRRRQRRPARRRTRSAPSGSTRSISRAAPPGAPRRARSSPRR